MMHMKKKHGESLFLEVDKDQRLVEIESQFTQGLNIQIIFLHPGDSRRGSKSCHVLGKS